MFAEYLSSALVTLLVTLDPPGLAPIFLSLTRGMSASERRQVAVRACIIAFCIMAFFGLAGDIVLKALGVSLPAFRIAGGFLLFWISFEMVFERRNDRKQATADTAITKDHIRNVAAFPLAIPLMAGPGALTADDAARRPRQWRHRHAVLARGDLRAGDPLLPRRLLPGGPIARLLGVTGNVVLTRLLGVILAALAVQFVIDGVRAVIRSG